MISFIVAMDKNNVIGKDNDLPWRLPADLAYFKKVTTGHAIVMGRKTFDSIGKPLPNRENIVITRNSEFTMEGCTVLHSIEEFLSLAKQREQEELFVIGGAAIFKELMDNVDKLYITFIDEEVEGDTYFPEIDQEKWELVSEEKGIKDEKNVYDYYFRVYDRK
ncbi:dihydrofolate reductase [Bacillus alkalicellulosilyticus]|uniref:dihydrofolate reductase n=1 Tax=Alkalihalobacterium alkalicellulosilyticum TaxID=1912214 RepID=UPI000998B2DD|nr:dihydrofolate reductase [Bacillus alkalicellulosilyticus]